MKKNKCIIIDVDGTLANIDHRRGYLEEGNDWKRFNSSMENDSLNTWCKAIVDKFKNEYQIILLTGREEIHKDVTLKWLKGHDVHFDSIFFRSEKDYRDDAIVKKELFERHIQGKHSPLFVVDDRKKVVSMWRDLGLVCLQCDWGDF
ncbi:HAD family acid phosphatase [Halobacteriovorax sp. JY17]|uniref:phosphatase domain-containing protein n=1 Tax=Halobacteriovorax sp. JY17 TaxID=2014617 RepID=UPI000C3C485B|nr:HAD family acid phosphatase [Halobacteriovorax sp. JY17]PIK14401.1 MAG: hypothetical protein CES88_08645 [Halobacteriovorax sp. JY17]